MVTDATSNAAAERQPRYWAFISYSHRNQKEAGWLHRALESYSIPKDLQGRLCGSERIPARLLPVFRDREDLSSAPSLSEKLRQALRESRSLVVICSPTAASSKWVNEEIRYFKSLGRAERVFCFIVSGKPKASLDARLAELECFPPAIRFQVSEDGVVTDQEAEPLAADARPDIDTRQGALLKLIAGILGVDLDELRRREQIRQQRRRAAITIAVATAIVVLTAFSLFSWIMWQRAELATVAANTATTKAQVAEKRERAAKEQAIAEKERAEKLTDYSLDYVSEIGTWFLDKLGTSPETRELCKEFLQFNDIGMDKLIGASPDSERARQLQSLFLVFAAQAHSVALSDQESEHAKARQDIAKAQTLITTFKPHPEDPLWEARNALFYTNLSVAQWALSEKELALANSKRAVDIVDKIDFTVIPASRALGARVYSNYGEFLAQTKQFAEAIDAFRQAQKTLEQARKESDPNGPALWDLELHNLLISISHVQQQRNRPSLAREALDEAMKYLAVLETRDGYGAAWSLRLFWSEYAEVCFQQSDFRGARTALERLVKASEALVDLPREELPREYREDRSKLELLLVEALEMRSNMEQRANLPEDAVAPFSRAVMICRKLATQNASDRYHEDYVRRALLLVDMHESPRQWDELTKNANDLLAYCNGLGDAHPDAHRLFFFRSICF